ncbi:ATP-binding cassette domain-containing protein [Maritimibacter sp. UBA3975]|uniref:ABC transporter ATP-binding protein n=1 Tax=Maritimibacter sp. UBA3975 TaxID=1946833 RepID=UPI000C0A471D|nr:ATP-binding cassette domain-containing protein [Maritimibacter sp. UBA3975]MAM61169.1 ABC transporter ATP-binding protein [Maritimibacter sp.]|tara:strand:+ start:5212 stop:5928 length:717 start_codon:yes stop_codon:yes gene_type:complete
MIALEHISKSFGTKQVLDDISLTLEDGSSLAVLGRSGTGKSVLTRIVLGLMAPDAGRVVIDGAPMTRRARRGFLEQTGVLFQGSALFDSMTVWENVAFRLRNGRKRLGRAEARRRAEEALDRVGLESRVADLFPADLSGGMQKRVGLARAIVGTPRYLFFDEPNSGLDPVTSTDIDALIRELVTDLGATAITITHDMASIRTIADEVLLLDASRARWHGRVADLATADDPLLARFLAR